jgi:hypothetical protein
VKSQQTESFFPADIWLKSTAKDALDAKKLSLGAIGVLAVHY